VTAAAGRLHGFFVMRRTFTRSPLRLSFSSSLSIQALNVVTGVALARGLGVTGRGELAAVVLWPTIFATAGLLGLPEALTYHSSRRPVAVGRLVGTAATFAAVQSVFLVGLGVLLEPVIYRSYGHQVHVAALLNLLHIPLWLVYCYLMATLNGLHRFVSFHFLRFLPIAVTALGLVSLALTHHLSLMTAVFAYLASDVVALAVAVVFLLRAVRPARYTPSRAAGRELLAFGLRSHPGTVAGMLNELLALLLISLFLGPTKLGLYVVAVTLSSLTVLIGSSVGMVALPSIARFEPGVDRTAAARRFVGLTLVFAIVVTIPVFVVAPILIRVFFGSGFEPAAGVARILLVAMVMLSTNRTLGGVVRAVNRPMDAGIAEAVALGIFITGLAILLPTLGLRGAALAAVAAYGASMTVMARKAARALDISVAALLVPGSSRP